MGVPMDVISSSGNRPTTLLGCRIILTPVCCLTLATRSALANVEEAEIQENYGQIPGRLTDQGERPQTPSKDNLHEAE
jgi:hypothetical protein